MGIKVRNFLSLYLYGGKIKENLTEIKQTDLPNRSNLIKPFGGFSSVS